MTTEIPYASPAGTQPAESSLATSWPLRSVVNGRAGRAPPRDRTAVPSAMNSRLLPSIRTSVSRTPTTPSAPSAAASWVIRLIARLRPCLRALT